MRIVLDASTFLACCFPDERDDASERLFETTREHDLIAPDLLVLESANALTVAVRRGRMSPASRIRSFEILSDLQVELLRLEPEDISRILELADAHGLSAYDATYLQLAVDLDSPLATRDGKLRAAAARLGRLFEP